MKTDITEIIAEFLSEVHSHSLVPFYKPHADVPFFRLLPEVAVKKDDVDKTFFREIAKELQQRMSDPQIEKPRKVDLPPNPSKPGLGME